MSSRFLMNDEPWDDPQSRLRAAKPAPGDMRSAEIHRQAAMRSRLPLPAAYPWSNFAQVGASATELLPLRPRDAALAETNSHLTTSVPGHHNSSALPRQWTREIKLSKRPA